MSLAHQQPIPAPRKAPPPALENGDRLTRIEFQRRYAALPNVKKAELVEGVVHMPSPVRMNRHGKPHLILSTWLGYYLSKSPGVDLYGDNSTVRLDEDNEYQPDLLVLLPSSAGGQAKISNDDYVTGPPDLACEIAASSVSIDMHLKLNVYRRNGVREYLVWRTDDAAVDWFTLNEGRYDPMSPDADGTLKSRLFPGLWLNVPALLQGDLPRLLTTVDQGVATPQHAEFLKRLRS